MDACHVIFQFLELKFVPPILSFVDLLAAKNLEVADFFRGDDIFYLWLRVCFYIHLLSVLHSLFTTGDQALLLLLLLLLLSFL